MLRKSRYNVVTASDKPGRHLLFNTASGAFLRLDDEQLEVYEACNSSGEPNAGVFNALLQGGFVCEMNCAEELAAVQKRFEEARCDHSELTLVIAPTYACNLCCPYCYEKNVRTIAGIMSRCVMDGIFDFVEQRCCEHNFERLSVQWYGGDPSLALGVVKELSDQLISLCVNRGMDYGALMLSNCLAIDEKAADVLASSKIALVLVTIDGLPDTQRFRRRATDSSDTFAAAIDAIECLKERGIEVRAMMNVDRVNLCEFEKLYSLLEEKYGIQLGFERLADSGHIFGTGDFVRPAFDLFDIDEYARHRHDAYLRHAKGPRAFQELLSPPKRFCNGQRDDYYVIDLRGDVYACDGYMGDRSHVAFSVFDEPEEEHKHLVSHDPFADEECAACKLLPLCLGSCRWERETEKMQCHPLKYTLEDYLRDWDRSIGET